jgi:hypothetical protein
MRVRWSLCFILAWVAWFLIVLGTLAKGATPVRPIWGAGAPDRRGEEVTAAPRHQGTTASAPIPPELHLRNEGGSDGAGLCVIASAVINGQYQGVPGIAPGRGKESLLWRTAKKRPGGYSPDKLAALLKETMPAEKYASYLDTDPKVLDQLSRRGYPVGATMNTGALYQYRPIHHMVSLIHYRSGGLACVVDNNDPSKYHWMPASEFDRRWIDGGTGWAFIWTRQRLIAVAGGSGAVLILAAAVLVIGRARSSGPACEGT